MKKQYLQLYKVYLFINKKVDQEKAFKNKSTILTSQNITQKYVDNIGVK